MPERSEDFVQAMAREAAGRDADATEAIERSEVIAVALAAEIFGARFGEIRVASGAMAKRCRHHHGRSATLLRRRDGARTG